MLPRDPYALPGLDSPGSCEAVNPVRQAGLRQAEQGFSFSSRISIANLDPHRVSEARVAAERAAGLEPQDENVRQTLAAVQLRPRASASRLIKEKPR